MNQLLMNRVRAVWLQAAKVGAAMALATALVLPGQGFAGVPDVSAKIKASPLGKVLGNWEVSETLVTGIYQLRHPSGRYEPYFSNEDATVLKTNQGWVHLSAAGLSQPEGPVEVQHRLAAIFEALRLDKAMVFKFGDGARRAVLISAWDCPSCRSLERSLANSTKSINATVYLFPMALRFDDAKGMQTATDLWCRADAAQAWSAVMAGRPAPRESTGKPADCGLRRAEATRSLAKMVGAKGVPALLLEDGRLLQGAPDVLAELQAPAHSGQTKH